MRTGRRGFLGKIAAIAGAAVLVPGVAKAEPTAERAASENGRFVNSRVDSVVVSPLDPSKPMILENVYLRPMAADGVVLTFPLGVTSTAPIRVTTAWEPGTARTYSSAPVVYGRTLRDVR